MYNSYKEGEIVSCFDNDNVKNFLTIWKHYKVIKPEIKDGDNVILIEDDLGNLHYFREIRFFKANRV